MPRTASELRADGRAWLSALGKQYPLQRHVYLVPTNAAGATFEIESLRLVFRREHLAGIASGVSWQGLAGVFQETLVSRSPEVVGLELDLPARPWLDLAVGTVEDGTRTAVYALAVLARLSHAGLGIDVERRAGLRTDESRDVLLADGEQWCAVDDLDPTIRFAGKESVFKAWAGMLDATPPLDLTRIPLNFDADSFTSWVRVGERPLEIRGRWTIVGERILSVAWFEARDVGNIRHTPGQ